MKLRHLSWAGIEIDHDGQTLLIDCLKDSYWLIPGDELVAPDAGSPSHPVRRSRPITSLFAPRRRLDFARP